MNAFDRQFQTGSPFLLVLFSAITLFFAGLIVLQPEHRYLSLLLVILSLNGAWKNYRAYRRRRRQGGFELLEEEM